MINTLALEFNQELFEFVLAPIISAQLFFTILLYFTIVRKRIAADYRLYNLFLISFVVFLLGRMSWVYCSEEDAIIILYTRMLLLLGIGLPSLLVAATKQYGIQPSKALYFIPYSIGLFLGVTYMLLYDYGTLKWFFDSSSFSFQINGVKWAHRIQILGAILQLVLPCAFLIIREMLEKRRLKLLLFLSGGFLFGLTLVIGVGAEPQFIGLYYLASIPVGLMWIWAVVLDIKDMKGKVGLLKEELFFMIQSDPDKTTQKMRFLLEDLEEVSDGNLEVYKMRIREILNSITDKTIEAGGDTEALVQRNLERTNAIQKSKDTGQVNAIIFNEALELSEIISENPSQKNALAVKSVMDYLQDNFMEDVSMDEIAKMAGVSKAHLMREFKKEMGVTILQYQTKLRIEASQQLLKNNTVSETAYHVGYNNPNYFSTVFRKVTGLSPLEYQSNYKEVNN
ncbi:helix-turn-helix transcriptional regulator [Flammeovirga aprica]|uniref:Helix-turn-helix transcriptional regulator n=1 Tax=Flammeovirga aprica JL-4 TaxID=694437 RepID=A0A7X9XBH1_9BACT|nr:AraC family transcriptional regulator [Flammeovirga aprica]NME70735.1 helix-turn-helix transcriptional regulator [Flammeovirga aprica JL-4]